MKSTTENSWKSSIRIEKGMLSSKVPVSRTLKEKLSRMAPDNGPATGGNKEEHIIGKISAVGPKRPAHSTQVSSTYHRRKLGNPIKESIAEVELLRLKTENQKLNNDLSEAKENINQLSDRNSQLVCDIEKLQMNLETSMIFLGKNNIDPVFTGKTLESVKDHEETRKKTMSTVRDLKQELENFISSAAEHRKQLQEFESKHRLLQEERKRCVQEQAAFENDLQCMQRELEKAKELLEM
ncbi:uncharacterized protein LOC120518454 isoform X1 [Polypterus senegalus]|uniref:uncharacterized protein LOC120518454 isoform X1 n=2 Tax=Polypterus senegalus TaxID=55291 RepID=UPI001963B421|nr:uncharacterized protein LOC120518454 isoform X1 [Polypterus senegalus]